MDAVEKKILGSYFGLLEGLTSSMKSDLIDRLSKSLKPVDTSNSRIKSAFGAWNTNESAEEVLDNIYSSRNTNRQIEEF